MIQILQGEGLHVFYFHTIERPTWGADEETEILRSVVLGRGVNNVAVTRQGVYDDRPSLRGLRSCIARSWHVSEVTCRMGRATVVLERSWVSEGDGPRYAYGGEYSTPIRLYRFKRVAFDQPAMAPDP